MNKNIWNLYKESERGKKAIELFTINKGDLFIDKFKGLFQKYSEYLGVTVEDYLQTIQSPPFDYLLKSDF